MTTAMSSTSDGGDDRPLLQTRNRTTSSKTVLAPAQHAGPFSAPTRERSRSSSFEINSAVEPRPDHRTPNRKRRARGTEAVAFVIDNSHHKTNLRQHAHNKTVTGRDHGSPGSSKSRSKAIGKSPLAVDVMSTSEGTLGAVAVSPRDNKQDLRAHKKYPTVADPYQAQFINLALNLSDGRRRQFSSNRISSPDPSSSSIPSSGAVPTLGASYGTGKHRLQLQDSADYVHLQDSPSSQVQTGSKNSSLQSPRSLGIKGSTADIFGLPIVPVEDFCPSETTLNRVQQAKEMIELSHEYRRLLQYLPRLQASRHTRSQSQSGWTGGIFEGEPTAFGRQYNPLQYIRNRKIRRRENNALNAEGEGWRSISAVRSWVDDISDGRKTVVSSVNDPFPLPPFMPPRDDLDFSLQSSTSALSSAKADRFDSATPSRERRPRIEWMIEPWNLLADAYWLEQDNHKHLIEDAKSRKIFPVAHFPPQESKLDITRHSTRRSASMSRSTRDIGNIIADESQTQRHGSIDLDRGRRPHVQNRSLTDNRDYSGSRSRRHAWKRFIGSHSPSSTEDSGSRRIRQTSRQRASMTKDRHDNRILEKQIMDLMTKQSQRTEHSQPSDDIDSFPTLNSIPSSPESVDQKRSINRNRDLIPRLGILDQSKEMQPRRFSANLGSQDRPDIFINVSPPRSRSRSAHMPDRLAAQGASKTSSDDEITKLSPKSAYRPRGSFESTRDLKPKTSREFDSKIRGIFRDSRITNIVSKPVANVGKLLWRRDHSDQDLLDSPPDSEHDYAAEEDLPLPPTDTNGSPAGTDSRYRPRDLPVFTSPFRGHQRGRSFENRLDSDDNPDASHNSLWRPECM